MRAMCGRLQVVAGVVLSSAEATSPNSERSSIVEATLPRGHVGRLAGRKPVVLTWVSARGGGVARNEAPRTSSAIERNSIGEAASWADSPGRVGTRGGRSPGGTGCFDGLPPSAHWPNRTALSNQRHLAPGCDNGTASG